MKIRNYIDKIFMAFIALGLIIFGFYNKFEKNEEKNNIKHLIAETTEDIKENLDTKVVQAESLEEKIKETETKIEKIIVHISGCVMNEGVYEFTSGDRIQKAVDRAGGLCEDADISKINLSQKMYDEMKIHILKNGETGQELLVNQNEKNTENSVINDLESNKKLININIATKDELMQLKGIGDVKAEAIINYRSNNKFEKISDIKNVKGIGDGTFEKIKDFISVN